MFDKVEFRAYANKTYFKFKSNFTKKDKHNF